MLVSKVSDEHVCTYNNYFSMPVVLNIKSLSSFLNQFDSTGKKKNIDFTSHSLIRGCSSCVGKY